MSQEEKTEEFLKHFGVKGMKWGVSRENRLQRLTRVADGSANRRDKAKVLLTETSNLSLRRNGGLQNAAAVRAANLEVRKERIQAGKGTVKDLIALHGGDKMIILGGQLKSDVDRGSAATSSVLNDKVSKS